MLDFGTERWACGIKLTADPKADDLARLNQVADLIDAKKRILVSRTKKPMESDDTASLDVAGFLAKLDKSGGRSRESRGHTILDRTAER